MNYVLIVFPMTSNDLRSEISDHYWFIWIEMYNFTTDQLFPMNQQ